MAVSRGGDSGSASSGGATHPAADDSAPPSGNTTIDPILRELARTPAVDIRARLAGAGGQIARFVVDRVLGEGGMGVVVAAHDPTLDRKVAIKLLRSTAATSAARTRLVREAQAAARVEHENVIAIHEVASVDDAVFVVMELVDGETLGRWQRGKPWRAVLDAYLRAGRGLAAAHDAGLVHRDFKPDNVLVGKDGRLRVTDFGLVAASGASLADASTAATAIDAGTAATPATTATPTAAAARAHDSEPPHALKTPLTRTGDVMGTPAYMAPEQYRGEPAGHAADQFAFCVALWEALYGLRPFDAASLAERQARIQRAELAGPLPGRDVPPRLEPILRRGLAADPAARWPDMRALLAALADDPDERARRRRRAVFAAAGIAALAAGTTAAAVLVLGGGADAPAPCRGLERDLDGAWDPARKDALTRAFAATGRTYAADVTQRVTAALDDRARALTARRVATCEATAVRRTQSPEMLDRTMACLDRRRGELAATVDMMLADAAASLPRALDAVLALPPLDACNADRLLDTAPPPTDPTSRDAIARIRADHDRAAALGRAGRWKDALAPATAAATAARALAYPPLVAETVALEARARLVTGDPKGATAGLHEAIAAAAAAKDAALGAQLTVALVEVANREARYGDVETLAALADANLGAPAAGAADERWAERATLAAERGRAARAQQKLDDARAHLARALELRTTHAGPDSALVARSLSDLGNLELAAAQWATAEALFRRALAINEKTSGPHHPDTANSLGRLAVTAKQQQRLDEAASLLRRGIDILTAAEGDSSPSLATMWANLGVVLGDQGKGADALAAYEKALAVREKVLPPDHPDLASSIMNVGIALQENLGRPADAVPYFERAKAILEKKLGPDHPTLAFALHGLGSAHLDMGRAADGVAALEHAYRIRSGPGVDPGLAANTGYMLAKALWESGQKARAREVARTTKKAFEALGYPKDDWLEAHGK